MRWNPAAVVVLWLDGVTVMEVTLGTIVSVVVFEMLGNFMEVAVMVAFPTPTAVANPEELSMLAIVVGVSLLQLTAVLPVLPSLKVPTAVNC